MESSSCLRSPLVMVALAVAMSILLASVSLNAATPSDSKTTVKNTEEPPVAFSANETTITAFPPGFPPAYSNPTPATMGYYKPIEGIEKNTSGVDWKGVLTQSAAFLAVEHGFRMAQHSSRRSLRGPFFSDWIKSVKSTEGWGDGDDFLTNYIGHPMEGSVAANIFVQNDPRGRCQIFGWNSSYWNSRLKATAWSALYSTQFELGPFSEASLGNVGYYGKSESGMVDLVVTPLAGLGWQVGEDMLDKLLIVKIENWTDNRMVQTIARGLLNPTRSFANTFRLKVPWSRDTRPGIWGKNTQNR